MEFFNSAIGTLQTLVIALGAGLGVWGVINLLEGYGNDNPGAKSPQVLSQKILLYLFKFYSFFCLGNYIFA
jgi:hypothetical protein